MIEEPIFEKVIAKHVSVIYDSSEFNKYCFCRKVGWGTFVPAHDLIS